MGGHGALTIALRNPQQFRSVSAFAPIVAPSQVPWGEKALPRYLGEDRAAWASYDACALLQQGTTHPGRILIDQGEADQFLIEQLRRSEEHTSELQSLMRISYAVFCLKKKKHTTLHLQQHQIPNTKN